MGSSCSTTTARVDRVERTRSRDAIPWIYPRLLERGDAVRVIAPSGPFESPLVWRALGWLAERYEVRFNRRIFSRSGYLAGSDDARLQELQFALEEPGIAAVFCARGGYGGNRIAHRADWESLRASPRWLVGFSDATALHVEATRARVASMHGPNLTALGRGDAVAREQVITLLERGPRRSYELHVAQPGKARGPLCGGNLSLLHSCAVAGRLALPQRAVLFVEEVGERPYRIDRMLTTLVVGGYFDEVSAVVLGDFVQCDAGVDGWAATDVARACLAPLDVPILWGLPTGHATRNEPLMFGRSVSVTPDGRLLTESDASGEAD